jgi:hypothetical protein
MNTVYFAFTIGFCVMLTSCGLLTDEETFAGQRGAEAGKVDRVMGRGCRNTTPKWSPLQKETVATLARYREAYLTTCPKTV